MIYPNIEEKKQLAQEWFKNIRDQICNAFEAIEEEAGSDAKFERKEWSRPGGGGGVMSVMKGKVFEKVGVNISTVHGTFSEKFANEIPGAKENPNFWASGISLVSHMHSPLIPTVHMNTRMIVTSRSWFGGGSDLTPTFPNEEDTNHFHEQLKNACDKFDKDYYPKFKQECDEYFYLRHRKEPRGVGGIFYDYINTNDWEKDFGFTQEVGKSFIKAYVPIVKKSVNLTWSKEEKDAQLYKRGRYVEFNLLYDRGTRFGIMTDGNVEAILMSLPPEAKWA
jgi:coproporphyrinogen III oxidase